MKIFNVEDGKRVVYIQLKDLDKIFELDYDIEEEDAWDLDIYGEYAFNPTDFIRIDKSNLVDYIKELDWIVDYSSFENLSEDVLTEIKNNYEREFTKGFLVYSKKLLRIKDKVVTNRIKKDLEKLEYKYFSIIDVMYAKIGKSPELFPRVINGEKTPLFKYNSSKYDVYPTLTENAFIVKRKDNGIIDRDDMDLELLLEILKYNLGNLRYNFNYVEEYDDNQVYVTFKVYEDLYTNKSKKVLSCK